MSAVAGLDEATSVPFTIRSTPENSQNFTTCPGVTVSVRIPAFEDLVRHLQASCDIDYMGVGNGDYQHTELIIPPLDIEPGIGVPNALRARAVAEPGLAILGEGKISKPEIGETSGVMPGRTEIAGTPVPGASVTCESCGSRIDLRDDPEATLTLPPLVQRLNGEIVRMFREPAFADFLVTQGVETMVGTPEEFADFMRKDRTYAGEIVKRFNIPKQ